MTECEISANHSASLRLVDSSFENVKSITANAHGVAEIRNCRFQRSIKSTIGDNIAFTAISRGSTTVANNRFDEGVDLISTKRGHMTFHKNRVTVKSDQVPVCQFVNSFVTDTVITDNDFRCSLQVTSRRNAGGKITLKRNKMMSAANGMPLCVFWMDEVVGERNVVDHDVKNVFFQEMTPEMEDEFFLKVNEL